VLTIALNCKRTHYGSVLHATLALACILAGATAAFAQEATKLAAEKWRPKDGLYESPGKDFDSDCRKEYGVFEIEFANRAVRGFEWNCKINKLADTAPNTIKLNMTCYDLNMPASAGPDSQERSFREVMLLERISGKSMSVRKTINGKFKGPSWQADFCPEDVQRAHIEQQKQQEEASKYKVPEQLLSPNQWRPKDGIYANVGPDFTDRCAKSGDVTLGLTEGSISSGNVECKVVGLMNTGQSEFSMAMTCSQPAGKKASKKKAEGTIPPGRLDPESSSADAIRMRRIDDNTFHMQKTVDKKFRDEGGPVAFCPEEAQQAYAAKRVKN
jgi:hypothetical protein